jgi:enamine deaminase RidA (YjgF/YER057c/UK114 family)
MFSSKVRRLNPEALFNSQDYGYSQISIVEPGRLAFVSGQAAIHPDGSILNGTLAEQTELALMNVQASLEALKADPGCIVQIRCHITDLDTDAVAEVLPRLQRFLQGAEPGLLVLGAEALANPDLRVAFELTVRVPD